MGSCTVKNSKAQQGSSEGHQSTEDKGVTPWCYQEGCKGTCPCCSARAMRSDCLDEGNEDALKLQNIHLFYCGKSQVPVPNFNLYHF